jgi:hypothetical protein
MNALALIDSPPVNSLSFTKAVAILEANYGTEYSPAKTAALFDMIREDGWSEERFTRTLKWFLKNKPFPAWNMADWFQHGVKIYPYAWYLKQQAEAGPYRNVLKEMDVYKFADGVFGYKWRDGEELPFERASFCPKCTIPMPMEAR